MARMWKRPERKSTAPPRPRKVAGGEYTAALCLEPEKSLRSLSCTPARELIRAPRPYPQLNICRSLSATLLQHVSVVFIRMRVPVRK
eukprot:3036840-Pyramimonas_sp.AAC.1